MSDRFSFKSEQYNVNDVLSSIRQLVSDEAQAHRVNGNLAEVRETLILTDADRVQYAQQLAPQAAVAIERDDLRQMVREIVEEELSGDFGDRMSRNIRKIARRAIANAIREGLAE